MVSPAADSTDTILRLVVAVAAGSVLGLNRELHDKPAGLRTHALVSLGGAGMTIIGLDMGAPEAVGLTNVTRVVQGVIAGIGFLGAGVIMRSPADQEIHGLTTAASIWVAATLGVGAGAGEWLLTGVVTGLALLILLGLPLERAARRLAGPESDDTEPRADAEP
jgi:putative Mg2+ transporter-C (MgtC) family protein